MRQIVFLLAVLACLASGTACGKAAPGQSETGNGGQGGETTTTGGRTTETGGSGGGALGGGGQTGGATSGRAGGSGGGGSGGRSGSGGAGAGGSAVGGAGVGGVGGSGTATTGAGTGGLLERIGVSEVTVPAGVKPGRSNFRVWGSSSLVVSPVYTVPLADCGTLVCITTGTADSRSALGTSHAYAIKLDAGDRLVATFDLGDYECRGLAAEPDGHFAALLWKASSTKDCADPAVNGRIYVSRFDAAGAPGWSTELANASGSDINCPTDFGLGESRMEFGGGSYGAYYHVHSKSGHEGDTLKFVDLAGKASTTWSWGCSHSMSNLLRWNGGDKKFMPACVTDCYPGTSSSDFATGSIGGVYINNRNKVIDVDAGCNGSVAGELGGAAVAPSGWKLVFNAHQAPATLGQSSYDKATMNQDIGFATVGAGLTASGGVVWLTTTSVNEADSGIERWAPAGDATEQYVVGWAETSSPYVYKLGRVDGSGRLVEGPIDVSAKARWGRRDDPFRAHGNGDIVWAWFDAASSTTLRFARLRSGGTASCATF